MVSNNNANSAGSGNNLINCRKCGSLFVKTSRDICDECYKDEVEMADKVKNFIQVSEKIGKEKVTVEEILKATKLSQKVFEELFEKGRMFSVMSKITVKCRFCSIEFECDKKPGFICPRCVTRFSDKSKVKKINDSSEEARRREKIARQRIAKGQKTRYGFIQDIGF